MEKLLYINNYHCTTVRQKGYPNNHLWGADALTNHFDVTCATVPDSIIRWNFKGAGFIDNFLKSLILLITYYRYPIVYAACGDLTEAFALANILHLGKRKLFQIKHHGGKKLLFSKGYTKILFISPIVADLYPKVSNKETISWGGDDEFVRVWGKLSSLRYDFISAGKSSRDHDCMIKAASSLDKGLSIIVTDVYEKTNIDNKIKIISGTKSSENSTSDIDVFSMYSESKFIVIPISKRSVKTQYSLSGLTSFVDAAACGKPVLVSDNTNMGIDVEMLGIGLTYKAGDANDMAAKMERLMNLSDSEYNNMCANMRKYSETHNYNVFCNKIVKIIKE